MSTESRKRQGEVPISHLPLEVDGDLNKFRISPLAVIEHVQGEEERELEKTIRENSVEYRVYSGVDYTDEDPTQKKWEKEYGIECFENGLVRRFVKYEPVNSTRESAQRTISEDIFTKLEAKTLRYYARNGVEEAAEILKGEKE
ncbi:MAG: hypothetical protein V5A72_01655 [Candidatus Nanohaloarchaea archaeon]